LSITTVEDRVTHRHHSFSTNHLQLDCCSIAYGNAIEFYADWERPTCIISDGPYGLGKYPGEAPTTEKLAEWYAPHVAAWAQHAGPTTTLWFWNSELGWATVHPVLESLGWQYEECCIWDKGIAHVAGNCNSKTIRGVPVVTEVAVRYSRRATLPSADGKQLTIKDWVRAEWLRSGLPMYRANEACGVLNAATRKYLTQCWRWYFPPPEAVIRMAACCERHGTRTDRPYFSLDGTHPPTLEQWERMRSKWNHVHGITNVWSESPVHGSERIKVEGDSGYLHANQKPIVLMMRQILASTDPNDVVWEPFGGLCSAVVASLRSSRAGYAAEINRLFFDAAVARIRRELATLSSERAATRSRTGPCSNDSKRMC
jgi:site-specific DNA-methyltransferase (adenine-specific)